MHDERTAFENSRVDLSETCRYKLFSKTMALTGSVAKLPPEPQLDRKLSTPYDFISLLKEKGSEARLHDNHSNKTNQSTAAYTVVPSCILGNFLHQRHLPSLLGTLRWL